MFGGSRLLWNKATSPLSYDPILPKSLKTDRTGRQGLLGIWGLFSPFLTPDGFTAMSLERSLQCRSHYPRFTDGKIEPEKVHRYCLEELAVSLEIPPSSCVSSLIALSTGDPQTLRSSPAVLAVARGSRF